MGVNAIKKVSFFGVLHLLEVLGRPVIALCRNLENGYIYDEQHYPSDREQQSRDPIYLYYNGYNHYDLVDEMWLSALLESRGLCAEDSAQGFVEDAALVIPAEPRKRRAVGRGRRQARNARKRLT